jgi:hypothetical protein
VAVSEEFEDTFVVVADRRQLDTLLLESRNSTVQLDQLPFAERSPVRGTKEKQNSSTTSLQRFESLQLSKLITNGKGRGLLPDRKPN